MCGRYTFFTDKELQEVDEIIQQISNDVQIEKMKTGEIFPTNVAPVLLPQGDIVAPELMKWGYPNFKNKGVIINGRSETAWEKRLFAASMEQRRCVIPSTGFYEWNKTKDKYLFNIPNSGMLYMAGLYNEFEGEKRFVILTKDANESIADVHNRMPVVLLEDEMKDWLWDDNKANEILSGQSPGLIKSIA